MVPSLFIFVCLCGAEPTTKLVEVKDVLLVSCDDLEISAQTAGVIISRNFKAGDVIRKGDCIAKLDATELEIDVARAKHELSIAKEQARNQTHIEIAERALLVAEAELTRSIESNEKFDGTVTKSELDRLKFTCDKLQLEIQQAQHESRILNQQARLKEVDLESAQLKLAKCQLISPMDGTLVRIDKPTGEWINPGEVYCRIIRIDRVQAEGFVHVQESAIRLGDKAVIQLKSDVDGTAIAPGVVTFVDPEIQPLSQQYRVRVEFENPDHRFRPGDKAIIRIQANSNDRTEDR